MKSVDSGSLLPRRGEGEDEGVSSRGHSPHPNPRPRWGEGGYGISELLTLLTKHLTSYSDAPHLDAERIVLHVLKKREPAYLLAHATDKLSDQQIQEVTAMANRRKTGMPLAYILGEVDFFGRTFIVTPDVLIPRPDTETLIEKAIEYIIRHAGLRPGIHEEITIADICTGSGIIVITLALELEKLMQLKANEAKSYRFIATDISPAAIAIAKQNAQNHGVADTIEFIEGDMLDPFDFAQGKPHKIDLIVSNPPYIQTSELDAIYSPQQPYLPHFNAKRWNVGLLFEPRIALDGGPDGQKFVNQIKTSGIPAIIETTGGAIITLVQPLPLK